MNIGGKMKKLLIAFTLMIIVTSKMSYASGLTDPVVEAPVTSEQSKNDGSGFKKFIFLLLLGVGL